MLIVRTQASDVAKGARFSWRRRLAGDFSDLHAAQQRRRDAGATTDRAPCLLHGVAPKFRIRDEKCGPTPRPEGEFTSYQSLFITPGVFRAPPFRDLDWK